MATLTGSKRLGGTSHKTPGMTLAECRKRIAAIKAPKETLTAAEKLELRRLNAKLKTDAPSTGARTGGLPKNFNPDIITMRGNALARLTIKGKLFFKIGSGLTKKTALKDAEFSARSNRGSSTEVRVIKFPSGHAFYFTED